MGRTFKFIVFFISLFFIAGFSSEGLSSFKKRFSPTTSGFLWGAAFSAYQSEGVQGGGEAGDWYEFSRRKPSPIENGDTAEVAVDFWNRYEEDILIAKSLGIRTLRTSIAWEKIEPVRGQYNQASLDHYHKIFATMRAHGITPMIAFHHFTHPTWFHQAGGWLNADSPKWFHAYAEKVVDALGDVCNLWITFNEPMMLVQMGYLKKDVPPQIGTVEGAFEAAYNMARAHRMAVAMIHAKQGPPNLSDRSIAVSGAGLAYAFSYFEPNNPNSAKDKEAVRAMMDLANWSWLRALDTGVMEFAIPTEVYSKKLRRELPKNELGADASGKMDWVGVNYYSRWNLRYNAFSSIRVDWVTPAGPQGDNGWTIYPKGLENILNEVKARFSIPILVTESGMADAADSRRPQAIRDHISAMERAMANGADVRGFYQWSLTDNFEWLSGYKYRFGLVEIDFKNGLKRKPRGSARVYADEISRRN